MWWVLGTYTVSGRRVIRRVCVVSVLVRWILTPLVDFTLTEFLFLTEFLSLTEFTEITEDAVATPAEDTFLHDFSHSGKSNFIAKGSKTVGSVFSVHSVSR